MEYQPRCKDLYILDVSTGFRTYLQPLSNLKTHTALANHHIGLSLVLESQYSSQHRTISTMTNSPDVPTKPAEGISDFTPAQTPPTGTARNPQTSGKPTPKSFQPLTVRGLTIQNRLGVSTFLILLKLP